MHHWLSERMYLTTHGEGYRSSPGRPTVSQIKPFNCRMMLRTDSKLTVPRRWYHKDAAIKMFLGPRMRAGVRCLYVWLFSVCPNSCGWWRIRPEGWLWGRGYAIGATIAARLPPGRCLLNREN
ncbi:hypothetical protein IG631_08465 [Alternaria alternata]|nr:hypothetical protein IG631_08465 [Alternaria alternata]